MGLQEWTPEEGTPQGAVISPLLGNLYLDPLDQLMADHGLEMVRYADDFVVLCQSAHEAQAGTGRGPELGAGQRAGAEHGQDPRQGLPAKRSRASNSWVTASRRANAWSIEKRDQAQGRDPVSDRTHA